MSILLNLLKWSVRGLIVLVALLSCLLVVLYIGAQQYPEPGGEPLNKLLLTNVTVIDVKSGELLPERAIRIQDGKITGIEPASTAEAMGGETTRDMRGAYAMPGMWDMHAHLGHFALYTAAPVTAMNGVLYVRELGSDCLGQGCAFGQTIEESRMIQRWAEQGTILSPIFSELASFHIAGRRKGYDGRYGYPREPAYLVPTTAAEGARLVEHIADRGLDFIKTYNSVEPEAYRAMLQSASQKTLYIGGHVPRGISLVEAVTTGHRSVEHARQLPIACSPLGMEYVTAYGDWASSEDERDAPPLDKRYADIVASYDPALCDEVITQWAAVDSYYVPTHITRRAEAVVHTREYESDPRLKYVPDAVVSTSWANQAESYGEQFSEFPEDGQAYYDFFEHTVQLTGRAYRGGVKVLLGTDVGDMLVYPGFSFVEEAMTFADGGIPNADILRIATLDAAVFSGMAEEHGSIESGKAANLFFVASNPLEDISALADITALYYQGAFYDEAAREAVLAEAAENAAGATFYLRHTWHFLDGIIKGLGADHAGDSEPLTVHPGL
ncbi:MAG: amidohydrolase family protein [Pseudomonadota bacterium]